MSTYTFYWMDGTREVLKGENVVDAHNHTKQSLDKVARLDFFFVSDNTEFNWNPETREWVRVEVVA